MNEELNSSSDFYFVSYAYAQGVQPSRIRNDGRRKIFIYDDPRYEDISTEYYAQRGMIEPIAFTNAIRNVKALIYNQ